MHRLWSCGFLVAVVCLLLGEADLEATAVSLETGGRAQWITGLVPAHWWVGLSLVPFLGKVMSRGVIRGGSVRSMILACLLMGGTLFPPFYMFVLGLLGTGACRLLGRSKFFQNGSH